MTERENQLMETMKSTITARRYFHGKYGDPSLKYICFEDLIVQHGQFFPRAAAPPPVRPVPRECFSQSYRLTMRKGARWIYCEGFALNEIGMPIHHAWVTKRDAPGEAFDLAWGDERHAEAVYRGIMFKPEFVRETHLASKEGMYSVLDAYWLRYPLMTGKVKIEEVRW